MVVKILVAYSGGHGHSDGYGYYRGWEQGALHNLGPVQNQNEGLLFQREKHAMEGTRI